MELSDLKGIGPVAVERLNEAGVTSVDELAQASVGQLTDAGMSDSKAESCIKRAQKIGVVVKTGSDVYADLQSRERITTGMGIVDNILGGGWRAGDITAIAGESGSGKTQLVFHSMVAAAEQTGRPVVYIETERNRFSPKRLLQFAESEDTLELIHLIEGHSLEQQALAYEKVVEHYEDCAMVVVDSFTANFRLSEEFDGRGTLSQRSAAMSAHLRGVQAIADDLQVPLLLTAQVYGNPDSYGASTAVYGGSLFHHTVNFFVQLADAQGSLARSRITHHPELPETEFYINIQSDGLEAMRDV